MPKPRQILPILSPGEHRADAENLLLYETASGESEGWRSEALRAKASRRGLETKSELAQNETDEGKCD